MKVQVLQGSKINPLFFLIRSEGITFEYELLPDTAPEVLKAMRAAARKMRVVELDANDIKSSRRIGVRL